MSETRSLCRNMELRELNIVECIPFLFLRQSRKLTAAQNRDVYASLADSGYWRVLGVYGFSAAFSITFYGIAKLSSGDINDFSWLVHICPLLILDVAIISYLQLKRHSNSYTYKDFIATQVLICPVAAVTWGTMSVLMNSAGGILSEVAFGIIAPTWIFTAIWLSTFPIACLAWLVISSVCVLYIEHGRDDYVFLVLIVTTFAVTAFLLCMFFFVTHIRSALDRIRARDQQQRAERLLQKFETYSPDFLWQTDNYGNLVYGSQSLMDMCRRVECEGAIKFTSIFNANAGLRNALQYSIEGSVRISMMQVAIDVEGDIEWWSLTGEPLFESNGSKTGFSGFATNITELKRIEDTRNKERSFEIVTQMASTIAHDFNNYLGSISGNLELMAIEYLRGCDDKIMDKIKRNTSRAIDEAGNLTRQLLLVGQSDVLSPMPINLRGAVLSVSSDVLAIYSEHLKIVSQLDGSEFAFVDGLQFARALRNVIENSALALNGDGVITISCSMLQQNSSKVRHLLSSVESTVHETYCSIVVRDDGPGFDSDMLDKALQPFATSRRSSGGTGIGLAMVDGFCRQSGGMVLLRNSAKKGALVEMVLPSAMGSAEAAHQEQAPTVDVRILRDNHVILLEDDTNLCEITAQMLVGHGMRVTTANSLGDLRRILPYIKSCDFMVADMELGDGYGYEVLEDLLELHPSACTVFVTGYINQLELKRVSADRPILLKPVASHALFRAMIDAKAAINGKEITKRSKQCSDLEHSVAM